MRTFSVIGSSIFISLARKLGEITPLVIGIIAGIAEVEIEGNKAKKSVSNQDSIKRVRGRPKISQPKENLVLRLRNEGYSYRSIKDQTGLALSTIRRIIFYQNTTFPLA